MVESEIATGYFCGRCRRHWATFLHAEACCVEACADCGADFGAQAVRYCSDDGLGRCWVCWRAHEERQQVARYSQAQAVAGDDWAGPVYWENRDRYYPAAIEAFMAVQDQVLGGEIERVAVRVYACTVKSGRITPREVLGLAVSGHPDGSEFDGEAQTVMASFLDLWNRRYADQVQSWFPDFNRKVVFPEAWWGTIPEIEQAAEVES